MLHQQETGSSLALEIENVLRVTHFTLTDNPQLEDASKDLYLQNYLQFHKRGTLLPFDVSIRQEVESNIIPFPKSLNP